MIKPLSRLEWLSWKAQMRIGFYANYTPETARFAHETGFSSLQLSAWQGSYLDAYSIGSDKIDAMLKQLAEYDIEISALGYYPNYFDPDHEEREKAQAYLPKVIDLAQRLGVKVVATFAGRDPDKTVEDNIPLFKELFSRFCDHAENRDVKIALENCPMVEKKTNKGRNIAFSPEVWDVLFDVVPSDYLGLEFDPSHLVWQEIDYVQAVLDYAPKIFHVHAKDMEIDRAARNRIGIYGPSFGMTKGLGKGWWRARAPGWGEVDWPKFISAVIKSGYRGNIDIEHEDSVFAGMQPMGAISSEGDIVANYSLERVGLTLGYKTLSQLIVR
jgi:sugar phosphate isomerase/epimerase